VIFLFKIQDFYADPVAILDGQLFDKHWLMAIWSSWEDSDSLRPFAQGLSVSFSCKKFSVLENKQGLRT